jgi:hypothetical protein
MTHLNISTVSVSNVPDLLTPILPPSKNNLPKFNSDFGNFKNLVSYLPLPDKSIKFRGQELWNKVRTMGKIKDVSKLGRSHSMAPLNFDHPDN